MDPDPQLMLCGIIIPLSLAFLCSLCYFSMSAASESRLKKLCDDGDEDAACALSLIDRLGYLWEVFSCLIAACFATAVICSYFLPIMSFAWPSVCLTAIGFTTVGILIPRSIGLHMGDDLCLNLVFITRALRVVSLPFYAIPFAVRYVFLLPFGMHSGAPEDAVTEEEIMMLLDEGEEAGAIMNNERTMIEGIFELDDTDAGDIMTHRTDIVAVDKTEPLPAVASIITEEGYSRIPVYDEDIDDIVGILFAKDLLSFIGSGDCENMKAEDIMHPVLYIPETMNCRDLITIMRENKAQLVIVVDEYGGTSGIVSMEDVLETIVGNIEDEYDDEDAPVAYHDDGTISMDGTLPLDEVEKILGISLPDQSDYDTLGGLITDLLGRIPSEEERPSIPLGDWQVTVDSIEDRRISHLTAKQITHGETDSPST